MFWPPNITLLPKQYIPGSNTITKELKTLSKLFKQINFDENSNLYHSYELLYSKRLQVLWHHNTLTTNHENTTNQATLYKSFNILLWTKKKESNQFCHLLLLGGIRINSLSNRTAVTQAATQAETQPETQAAALQTHNFDTPSDHTSLVMINHNNILEELRRHHCREHHDITTSSTIYRPWRRSNLLRMLRPIPTSLRHTSSERLQDRIWSFLKHWTKKRT